MERRSFFKPDERTGKGSRTGLSEDRVEEQAEADPGGSKGRTENSKFQLQSDARKNRGPPWMYK